MNQIWTHLKFHKQAEQVNKFIIATKDEVDYIIEDRIIC